MSEFIEYKKKDLQLTLRAFNHLKKQGVINKSDGDNDYYSILEANEECLKMLLDANSTDKIIYEVVEGEGYFLLTSNKIKEDKKEEKNEQLKARIFIMLNLMVSYSGYSGTGFGFKDLETETGIDIKEFKSFVEKNRSKYLEILSKVENKTDALNETIAVLKREGFLREFKDILKLTDYGVDVYKEMKKSYDMSENIGKEKEDEVIKLEKFEEDFEVEVNDKE